jgi:hypothetical protein
MFSACPQIAAGRRDQQMQPPAVSKLERFCARLACADRYVSAIVLVLHCAALLIPTKIPTIGPIGSALWQTLGKMSSAKSRSFRDFRTTANICER